MAKEWTIYEVVYNVGTPGPFGDGTAIFRTKSKSEAEDFIRGRKCYSGDAEAIPVKVPSHIAKRWGF